MDIEALRSRLLESGQEHLLRHWNTLNNTEKQSLYDELNAIDFKRLSGYVERCQESLARVGTKLDASMEPLPQQYVGSVLRTDQQTLKAYEAEGTYMYGTMSASYIYKCTRAVCTCTVYT